MNQLIPIEFKNQRILTTRIMAEQFGTDEKVISNNYNRNIERFVANKHFIKLEGDDLKEFKGYHLNDESLKFVSILYLWTDRGAARHAKILETDEAWEIYEKLEESYFNPQPRIDTSLLSPETQLILRLSQSIANNELEQRRIQQQLNKVNHNALQAQHDVQAIRDVVSFSPKDDWRGETNKIISKVCKQLSDYKLPKEEIYKALQYRAGCDLKRRLENMRGRMALDGATRTKLNNLNYLDVIAEDKKLIEIYIQIIREMAIKYKIA